MGIVLIHLPNEFSERNLRKLLVDDIPQPDSNSFSELRNEAPLQQEDLFLMRHGGHAPRSDRFKSKFVTPADFEKDSPQKGQETEGFDYYFEQRPPADSPAASSWTIKTLHAADDPFQEILISL